jgi:hypothetical protein
MLGEPIHHAVAVAGALFALLLDLDDLVPDDRRSQVRIPLCAPEKTSTFAIAVERHGGSWRQHVSC